MFVTFSTRDVKAGMERIEARIILAQSIFIVLIVIFSFFMAGRLVKPFRTIETTIDKVSNGYMDERLLLSGYTETEKIADAFNSMLDKLKKIEDSRQEFVSNVSHELKTPITSIKVLADSLLMQEEVPNEMYREFFKDIANEVDRENEIITDLLTLVRLDKQTTSLNFTSVNINEMVELILRRLRPIAAKRNIEVVLESFRPIIADVDEIKISSAFTNLVENAIKYNVIDGCVRVTLNADHRFFYLKVADSGIGIPQESLDQVFERFYRVDKARSREMGGTGLGLAITKEIVESHGGSISAESELGEYTRFTVNLPLAK
jgi:signal transduction histidine kinase